MLPTTTGWFQVLPSMALNRPSSVNWPGVALALAATHATEIQVQGGTHGALATLAGDRRVTVQRFLEATGGAQ